jgi:hypothetical protein
MNFELKLVNNNLKRSQYPILTPEELDENLTALQRAIMNFQEIFWGSKWDLVLGERVFTMWVEDISYFWDELPENLRKIRAISNDTVRIEIVNQGSEKLIQIKTHSTSELEVMIVSREDVDNFYDYYSPGQLVDNSQFPKHIVRRSEFLSEWNSFIDVVLDQLINNNLIDSADKSIKEFKQGLSK